MGNVLNVTRSHQIGGELKSLGECVFGVGGVSGPAGVCRNSISKFGERTVKFPQTSAWVLQEWLRIDEIWHALLDWC